MVIDSPMPHLKWISIKVVGHKPQENPTGAGPDKLSCVLSIFLSVEGRLERFPHEHISWGVREGPKTKILNPHCMVPNPRVAVRLAMGWLPARCKVVGYDRP